MTNEEKKKEAKRRYKEGYSVSEIALALDVNENTLRSWKRRGEWKVSASAKTVQKNKERKTVKKELKKHYRMSREVSSKMIFLHLSKNYFVLIMWRALTPRKLTKKHMAAVAKRRVLQDTIY